MLPQSAVSQIQSIVRKVLGDSKGSSRKRRTQKTFSSAADRLRRAQTGAVSVEVKSVLRVTGRSRWTGLRRAGTWLLSI